MNLKLYNTLSRTKESFAPLDWRPEAGVPAADRSVRMYVCGPTVYDFAHIGNARPVIVFDVLFRLLRHLYGADHVKYVRNITDVDDKINARAAERGVSIRELTEETYRNFKDDVAALGCLPPTVEPRATEYVRRSDGQLDMVTLIERLIANGNAYVAEGHVLFDVPSMPDYGQLSRRPLDEMIAGARVDVAPYKRDSMDFVLWKPSKSGEPSWDSPWGQGRPGWHIECSAMSGALLGETFDIHGGGIDLVFPHHENEIAQSRCAFHTPTMAQVWMHNGFLQVEGEKMAKSAGNFVTIRELLTTQNFGGRSWPGQVLRLAMLRTHYTQPIDWTISGLEEAWRELRSWSIRIVASLEDNGIIAYGSGPLPDKLTAGRSPSQTLILALSDDLNTPLAQSYLRGDKPEHKTKDIEGVIQFFLDAKTLGLLDERSVVIFANGINAGEDIARRYDTDLRELRTAELNKSQHRATQIVESIKTSGMNIEPICDGCWHVGHGDRSKIQQLVEHREVARKAKNFAEADRIRGELAAMGVVLQDSKDGTTWEVAR